MTSVNARCLNVLISKPGTFHSHSVVCNYLWVKFEKRGGFSSMWQKISQTIYHHFGQPILSLFPSNTTHIFQVFVEIDQFICTRHKEPVLKVKCPVLANGWPSPISMVSHYKSIAVCVSKWDVSLAVNSSVWAQQGMAHFQGRVPRMLLCRICWLH